MRSTKLSAAIAAAATLLALAPAGALAARLHPGDHKHAGPGGCRINLAVAPRLISSGQSALAYGQLNCGKATSVGSQTVTLYERSSFPTGGFTAVGTATTNESGIYSLSTGAVASNSQFYVAADEAQSGKREVRVSAQVTVVGPPETTQLITGEKVTFTGAVSPDEVGAIVVLQRQNSVTGDEWHRIEASVVKAHGVYSISHVFRVPGASNIRVVVRPSLRNAWGASNELNYQISQAQNANLTITSSADPIPYGSSVTISGKVAGGKETPVTLLARGVKQTGFAPVAVIKTDASGNYTFPAQSPLVNTLYKVKGATATSAVLYEGVKDILTPEPVPTTVAAGQTVTFAGAVSPDRSGHLIYLERENASGNGFHVVDVAVIEAGTTATTSKYKIEYQDYTTGVYRIKIPGDAENSGAVSQLFPIEVTPATPTTLPPVESPNNSQQPPQGQV